VVPLVAQVPAAQMPVQQSLGRRHGVDVALHGPASTGAVDAQTLDLHSWLQQLVGSTQVEPRLSQLPGWGGVPKHTLPVHRPPQHPAFCVQNPPASVHAGWPMRA